MPQVSLETLVSAVRAGTHLASFPTDTVPALAAKPDRADLIFTAKQRSFDKPLILMASEIEELWHYVKGSDRELELWNELAQKYLPGALTLVLPSSDRVPTLMNPNDPTTIGVRVPNHKLARQILAETGALATTSANRSGQPALLSMDAIAQEFPEVLMIQPESAEPLSGTPSTVVKWTGAGWEVLRQGAIKM
ncbi:MAG: L-threonylcarbamoyladenylate synthase [Leptolyngbya sp. Prado105]|jgi:L-threonylcarbamoyladenylate synthase|nr:L-threonylcarbamoyladenylate synthase [Leptolyngbya sp. Prado105]